MEKYLKKKKNPQNLRCHKNHLCCSAGRFLMENCEEEIPNFDLLNWWKNNSWKYRIFSLVARDILAIPLSTVASKSILT